MTTSKLWALIRAEPTRTMAVATVVLGWLALAGVPAEVVAGAGTILGLLIGGPVRSAVTPVSKVAGLVEQAAEQASAQTAKTLSAETVGEVGALTEEAAGVAQATAVAVAGQVLGPKSHRKQ